MARTYLGAVIFGFGLPYFEFPGASPEMHLALLVIIFRLIVALVVGYFAKRKGYSFWLFFVVTFLLDILASAVIMIAIPRRYERTEGELGASRKSEIEL